MTDDETTVSGTTIEPHWRVVSADVIEIGEVLTTVGDRDAEIFDGSAITHHGGPGVVHLTVAASDADGLPEHDVPESAEIEPETASLKDRIETDIEHWTGEDRTY